MCYKSYLGCGTGLLLLQVDVPGPVFPWRPPHPPGGRPVLGPWETPEVLRDPKPPTPFSHPSASSGSTTYSCPQPFPSLLDGDARENNSCSAGLMPSEVISPTTLVLLLPFFFSPSPPPFSCLLCSHALSQHSLMAHILSWS